MGGIAHLSAIKSRVPFVHFFDGFRTSHEVQKVEAMIIQNLPIWLTGRPLRIQRKVLEPGASGNPWYRSESDIFFQAREASNKFYDAVPDIVATYMDEISKITGRDYKPFNYYGSPEAEHIIIAMGSVTETIEETIDYLMEKGEKVGVIKVRLYRPFSAKYFFDVLPASVKRITVLDRTKEPGAPGEPLYLDIKNLFYNKENRPG